MTKITHSFYRINYKRIIKKLSFFVLLLMGTQMSWAQSKQLTGQFPGVDGGFEGQAVTGTALTVTTNVADAVKWNSGSSSFAATVINNSTAASRTGDNSLSCNVTSGTKYLISPSLVPTLTGGTDYVVQYYYKSSGALAPTLCQSALAPSGTPAGSTTTYLPATYAPNIWIKSYRVFPAVASPTTANFAGVKATGAASPNNLLMALDDFVVYQGSAVDNTAPLAPSAPFAVVNSSSGVDVSWTPSADVDGGGYMVVRYSVIPNADNDPNVNGIYAKNNTITNGTGSLVGTVVYTGTATSFTDATLVAGSYYKVYTVDKAFNYSNEVTAGLSVKWDTAWSNTVGPDSTLEAIIDGVYSGAAFNAKKLTVNSGKSLTITSGNLTIQNEVVNNGVMVVGNNANLIQVNSTVNTGAITVNRNSSSLLRLDYTLWSSPVAGQNLAVFSPLTSQSPSRFYTYDTAANLYNAIADPTTTSFGLGTGCLIRMPNTADAVTPAAFAGQFTGVPNNGDVPVTMVVGGAGMRFNLVGNPYPSPIAMSTFVTDNANIRGTLYFWRKTNGVGTAYCTWAGGVFTTNSNAQSVDPAGVIQTGQGFFVEANGSGTALIFKNGQRAANTTGQFFKTKQVATSDKIWLNATNTAGDFSQMAVNYTEGATQGIDAFDGKYINDSPLALTSTIDNDEYTIQGRSAFDATDVVPLNFKTNVAGDYTIAIDHTDGVFATGQSVILTDASTGTETDLTTSAYSFTAAAGTASSRFSLKYQKTLGTNQSVFSDNNVVVYRSKGTLYVNAGDVAIANIKVYDVQGRLVAELKNVKATSATIANLKATNQVLVVKITSKENKVVTKKVVN